MQRRSLRVGVSYVRTNFFDAERFLTPVVRGRESAILGCKLVSDAGGETMDR